MDHPNLKIVQISTADIAGGAEKVAWNLHHAYQAMNLLSYLIVGDKKSNNSNIIKIKNNIDRDNDRPFSNILQRKNFPVLLRYALRAAALDWQALLRWLGLEDFDYPDSRKLLSKLPDYPDIYHAHNLHGGYFDLSYLPQLSQKVPVVITLHDEWLMTGHCAYSINCERWQPGCGSCPDLSKYPMIRHDLTKINSFRKKNIYLKSCLFLATPCHWLADRVNKSILEPFMTRVIPYGIDQHYFSTQIKQMKRAWLNLPQDNFIILFAANKPGNNVYKDYETIQKAVHLIENREKPITFITLGGEAAARATTRNITIIQVPFQTDPYTVASYYQASDLFLHAAKADTFPNTVLEALCCGTPVIATAVGGIPEQIKDGQTGLLVPPGDSQAMAAKIEMLLADSDTLKKMSQNAAEDGKKRFDLQRMAKDYLDYYEEVIQVWEQRYQRSQ